MLAASVSILIQKQLKEDVMPFVAVTPLVKAIFVPSGQSAEHIHGTDTNIGDNRLKAFEFQDVIGPGNLYVGSKIIKLDTGDLFYDTPSQFKAAAGGGKTTVKQHGKANIEISKGCLDTGHLANIRVDIDLDK